VPIVYTLVMSVGSVQGMGDHAALADRSSWSVCG
jgi:hypothetical protein